MIKKDNTFFAGIFSLMVSYCVMPFVKHVCPDTWIYWMILVALIGLVGGGYFLSNNKENDSWDYCRWGGCTCAESSRT